VRVGEQTMSSRVINLSKQRDLLEWEVYVNELRNTGGIFQRRDRIQELHGDKAASRIFRQHCHKYDPTAGSLKYAIKHDRFDLLNLIIGSGKN